jgi:hypothetical protein
MSSLIEVYVWCDKMSIFDVLTLVLDLSLFLFGMLLFTTARTIFNIISVIFLLPMSQVIEKLAVRIVRDTDKA